ncbi:MAG TPA: hypothetical protein VEZ24_10760 [Microvirga sp.]|nr:hypothetical protein [Microvirga sp.]
MKRLKERERREDLSCIIDSHGDTVELWLGEQINLSAAGAALAARVGMALPEMASVIVDGCKRQGPIAHSMV